MSPPANNPARPVIIVAGSSARPRARARLL